MSQEIRSDNNHEKPTNVDNYPVGGPWRKGWRNRPGRSLELTAIASGEIQPSPSGKGLSGEPLQSLELSTSAHAISGSPPRRARSKSQKVEKIEKDEGISADKLSLSLAGVNEF